MRLIRSIFLLVALAALPVSSFGGIYFSVGIAPPPLPVYTQPLCPGPDYIWVPGYWAYGDYGYYWVPGTWVLAPFSGALWTPGYWGWGNGLYVWHDGYWGTRVGFYGGIDYGFGYPGAGYFGGYWNHGSFYYNRAVNHLNRSRIHNVFNRPVSHHGWNRVSYNGGRGGIGRGPSSGELAAVHDRRSGPTRGQAELRRSASAHRGQFRAAQHGRPSVLATSRPAAFARHESTPNRPAVNRSHEFRPMNGVQNGWNANRRGNVPVQNGSADHGRANRTYPSHAVTGRHATAPRTGARNNFAHSNTGRNRAAAPRSHGEPRRSQPRASVARPHGASHASHEVGRSHGHGRS